MGHSDVLVARLRAHPPFRDPYELRSTGSSGHRAAVAVLLVPAGDDLDVVLTKRTGTMAWANEVVFPGGKLDSSDPTLAHAALREADEEVGLLGGLLAHPKPGSGVPEVPEFPPFQLDVPGVSLDFLTGLPLHLAKDSLVASPFVFLLRHHPDFLPVRNPREVAPRGIFRVPLSAFLGPRFRYSAGGAERGPPQGVRHSVWSSWWRGRKVHDFHVPARVWCRGEEGGTEEHKVTWMTADILVEVASIAFAAKPTFEFNDDWAAKVSELGNWAPRGPDEMRAGRL
ncbi:hypothetical protein DFJ74DRAFT_74480 [Hyaloraphidium curvatum]|nr:hypothetical protein DFJ74DRAFT_74480 [Hyaloraphidium curvatum]